MTAAGAAAHRSAGVDQSDVALETSHRPVEGAVDGLVFILLVGGLNHQRPLVSRVHDPRGIWAVQVTLNHPGLGGGAGAGGGSQGFSSQHGPHAGGRGQVWLQKTWEDKEFFHQLTHAEQQQQVYTTTVGHLVVNWEPTPNPLKRTN